MSATGDAVPLPTGCSLSGPDQPAPPGAVPLHRRGVLFGHLLTGRPRPPDQAAALARWRAAEPVLLPAVLGDALRDDAAGVGAAIAATLAMFDRLRAGETEFLDELDARLADDEDLRYAGSTIDRSDPREIERVFVDAWARDAHRRVARDLYAKLAWIADDESDASLRIRFSSGKEQRRDWSEIRPVQADWTDAFCQRAFPECAAALDSRPLREWLGVLLQQPTRLSERIVYNNAPGGGAVFHHDAEPQQLGVVFVQLRGRTAWFALAKERLAALLTAHGFAASPAAAMQALDRGSEPHDDSEARDPDERDVALWQLLNRDPAFAQRLATAGTLSVLAAGDAIVLPSHDRDRVAWHSVCALDDTPSLAYSYAIFAAPVADQPAVASPPPPQ